MTTTPNADRQTRRPKPTVARKHQPARAARTYAPGDLKNPALYINREMSWLAFNERVLAQARDPRHPLLERVKFLAIVGSNLDEFFMIRVATTVKKLKAGLDDVGADGMSTEQQLPAMRERAYRMLADQAAVWEDLRTLLAAEGLHFVDAATWTPALREYFAERFRREIGPALTPLAFDPGHPFPFMSNRSRNFAVVVKHGGRTRFARVKMPDALPRFLPVPEHLATKSGQTFAFIEDVVRDNLGQLFPGVELKSAHLFRLIRDADLEVEQAEADDLLETVDRTLKQLRHGAPSLLQVETGMPSRVLQILEENFEAGEGVVHRTPDRHGFSDWMQLMALHRPPLKDPPFSPRTRWAQDEDPEAIFDELRYQDVLLHHPYDSFGAVNAFVRAAAKDPHVIAIKMTLYRIGQNSPLIDLLIEAAEAGKQVAVLVELKARFDERNNILWARRLEEAGVHVVYGWVDMKTHAKLCLVVRQEPDGVQRYVHAGTGNYNADTAKVYTDLGLFTANPDIVADVAEVFNYLTGYSSQKDYRQLLVAPVALRNRMTSLIGREAEHATAGRGGRMIVVTNAVTDDQMIRALYRASQAGVEIDIVARGICCLRPGIAGVSEHIRVRSIVGRFLEHCRLYWFENGGDPDLYIGSADLMERNLDRRVETLCPVRDPALRDHLRTVVIEAYLRDNERAWTLDAAGVYHPAAVDGAPFAAQQTLLEHYLRRD
jgi:polyphosphate kinase